MGTKNNNKELFELLDGTESASGSEVQQLVIPPRKKRFRRRLRNHSHARHEGDYGGVCSGGCGPRTVTLTLLCIAITCWLLTLSWLAVVLHTQIFRLNSDVQQSKYLSTY